MKKNLVFLFIIFSNSFLGQNFVLEKTINLKTIFYTSDYLDNLVYFLTNEGLLVIKYNNENDHQLVFTYKLEIDSHSLLCANNDKLCIYAKDTVYHFDFGNLQGPLLLNKYYYPEQLVLIKAFGPFYIFNNYNSSAVMVELNSEIQKKYFFQISVTPNHGFVYPYMIEKSGNTFWFYKYVENNPFQLTAYFSEKKLFNFYVHKNFLTYIVFYQPYPPLPPHLYFIATRAINVEGFPILWSANVYPDYGLVTYIGTASFNYFSARENSNGTYNKIFNIWNNYNSVVTSSKYLLTNNTVYFYQDSLYCKKNLIPVFTKHYISKPNYLIKQFDEIVILKIQEDNSLKEIIRTSITDKIFTTHNNIIITKKTNNEYNIYKIINNSLVFQNSFISNENINMMKYFDPYLVISYSNKYKIYQNVGSSFKEIFYNNSIPSNVEFKDSLLFVTNANTGITNYRLKDSVVSFRWHIGSEGYYQSALKEKYLVFRSDNKIYLIDVEANSTRPTYLDTLSIQQMLGDVSDLETLNSGIYLIYIKQGFSTTLLIKFTIENSKFREVYRQNLNIGKKYKFLEVGNGKLMLKNDSLIYLYKDSTVYSSIKSNKIEIPSTLFLSQNYPNPFNPKTKIQFSIRQKEFVKLKIYDILGNEVASLINEERESNLNEIEFDAAQYNLSNGVYFYQLSVGSFIQTRKMIYLK